jgi:hypothetical protein
VSVGGRRIIRHHSREGRTEARSGRSIVVMNLTRSAYAAALATVALWTVKAVAIAVAGGLGKSPLESPLFLLGLLACFAATLLVGAAAFAHRALGWRILGAVLALVVVSVAGTLASVVVTAVQPAHPQWFWGEINLWVIMLVVLAGAVVVRARAAAPAHLDRVAV